MVDSNEKYIYGILDIVNLCSDYGFLETSIVSNEKELLAVSLFTMNKTNSRFVKRGAALS